MPNTQPDEIVTTSEAASILLSSTSTVNRWAEKGTLPQVAKGNGIRGPRMFRREDVEALARERIAS